MHHPLLARATKFPDRRHIQKYAKLIQGAAPFSNPDGLKQWVAALEHHLAKAEAAAEKPKDKRPRKYAKLSERVARLERVVEQLSERLAKLGVGPGV